MAKAITINKLTIGYTTGKSSKMVAHQLNATLREGEMTCLLGANGKGKSTLMKTICGFLPALSGSIEINGQATSSLSEKELARQIAIVLTEKLSVPNATVYELVAYGRSPFTGFMGRLSAKDKAIVNAAIEQCGIAHKKHVPLAALSDGERQKATIAKALAQDTGFIILDEPTAFLDLPARVEIMQLLRQLASNGKSILMSTHDLDLALQMSDRLWLLHHDHIITGSPEDLLLQNAFQSMFSNKGIEFDNKTGMFKVRYQHQATFAVKGHGFEYVLLRRALLRKGIKPTKMTDDDPMYILIKNEAPKPFELWYDNSLIHTSGLVEDICARVVGIINKTSAMKPVNTPVINE